MRDRVRRRARHRPRVDGVRAPAVLLASFLPMFFIAATFHYMNRAHQDRGTTFSWATRALGPWPGWLGGCAICTSGIRVGFEALPRDFVMPPEPAETPAGNG